MSAVRRRSLVYIAAWAAATSFGVAISWAGVRGVLYTAALSPPAAVTVPSSAATRPPRPSPTPSHTPTSASPSPSPSRTTATTRPRQVTRTPRPSDTGKVRSFTLRGGHVALAFYPHRIRLVSATPDPGWDTNVWDDPHAGWLRVEFHRDDHSSAIFGVWHDGKPRVQFYDT